MRESDPHGCALLAFSVLALGAWLLLCAVVYVALLALRAVGL